MASFVIIYSVLYLPICTLADNALLNKKTQEMEYKENVSMNSNALSFFTRGWSDTAEHLERTGKGVLLRTVKGSARSF